MSASLLTLCAAAAAFVAIATSILVCAALAMSRRWWNTFTPAAEARILLFATLLPMLVCVAVMTAALAPSFGWIVDHCNLAPDAHVHPHICVAHHVGDLPAVAVLVLATAFFFRLAFAAARLGHGAATSVRTRQALERASLEDERGMHILPFGEPRAFVIGALRPTLFVTRGLLSEVNREHLAPVLSHERAHLRRRDPLRRLIASMALAFHLPGLASWLERRLSGAHEMAADAAAANETSPTAVALALVRLARAEKQGPRMAHAFGDSNVERRVRALLDARQRHDRPAMATLITISVSLVAIVGVTADTVHHGIEIVLGLFGR